MGSSRNVKDIIAGLVFVGLALVLGIQSRNLPLGTPTQLGPGAYPLLLIAILGVMGLIIAIGGLRRRRTAEGDTESFVFGWKPFVLVLFAPVLFGLLVRGLGVVPAIAIAVLASTLAAPRFMPIGAIVTTLVLAAFSWVVFIYFFGLPWRTIGPWLGG